MAWFLLVACLVASLWCLLYWWPNRRLWSLAGKIPGPRGYPLIGSASIFMGKITDTLPALTRLFKEHGRLVRLWLGPSLFLAVLDPDDIQVILGDPKIRNREKVSMDIIATYFGYGLLSLRGEEWNTHRRLIAPSFHYNILESYIEVFGRKSQLLVGKLSEFEGKRFNVYDILALCTLDSICETAIGTAVNSLEAGQSDLVDCFHACSALTHKRVIRPWLWNNFMYSLSKAGRQGKPLIETVHAFSEGVIAKKLDEFRRGIRSPGITTASNRRLSSFLDMLIEASESQGSILSPEEIRDEVTTLAATGLETTATTMSFLLVLIAIHPEVQAELHRELDEVFGSDDRPATSEDVKHLHALERCIKETLRLFPVAPILYREIDQDVLLPSGYTVPAKATVTFLPYATHRDSRYYDDPLRFWPDRWLPENTKTSHPYAYLPFGAGSRACIGKKYAQLQMKCVLSQVLRNFRVASPLTMDSLQRLEFSISLTLDQEMKEQFCIQLYKQ